MKVKLLASYGDESVAYKATGICVDKEGTINSLRSAVSQGHMSVLEHLPLTFHIEDITRACLAQLTRHRHMSFSVMSQRYCNFGDSSYTTPKSIIQAGATGSFDHLLYTIQDYYNSLVADGVPKEDARAILPNAMHTSLVVSMNARAFIEASKERLCLQAQEEIRELFHLMKEEIKEVYPTVYYNCTPKCSNCTETRPCKRKVATID